LSVFMMFVRFLWRSLIPMGLRRDNDVLRHAANLSATSDAISPQHL
jgi:hypothetical protein